MTLKQELQAVMYQLIGTAASSIFLEKCVSAIHESADDRASLLAVADKVSKRIALFVDEALAQKVFEALKTKIDTEKSSFRSVRMYKRLNVFKTVRVTCDGRSCELDLQNLSLGGMYVKTDNPFSKGSDIDISLPLENEKTLRLKGVVVQSKDSQGNTSKYQPGMGIQFKEMQDNEFKLLREYIEKLSIEDCHENKT